MRLEHEHTLAQCTDLIGPPSEEANQSPSFALNRVHCLTISGNQSKLAACFEASSTVVLYDLTTNEQRDRFALKASTGRAAATNAAPSSAVSTISTLSSAATSVSSASVNRNKKFTVAGLCFSPDSEKLAVGQSDCVIYVYRIGSEWKAERKTIVNKFNLASGVSALQWLPTGLVFGSMDGRVKFIHTATNKMFGLAQQPNSVCVSVSCTADGGQLVAGFVSGSIVHNSIAGRESAARQVAQHSCPPTALVLTTTGYVCAGGSDGRILFLELVGSGGGSGTGTTGSAVQNNNNPGSSRSARSNSSSSSSASSMTAVTASPGVGNRQTIEWGADISGGQCSPSGTVLVFSTRDCVLHFELDGKVWRHKMTVSLPGSLLVTGLCWSGDGTKLAVSTVNGALELFRCRWRRKLVGGRFEVNYVGTRQVVVEDLQTKATGMFATASDVREVKIIGQRHLVVWTATSLVLASLDEPTVRSEIEWHGASLEGVRFSFDYEGIVMMAAVGELFLVELGSDRILGSVRTDYTSPHLLSVRLGQSGRKGGNQMKLFAYLLDAQTISVVDLNTGQPRRTWSHQQRIDWLELNESGTRLIFRDKALQLVLQPLEVGGGRSQTAAAGAVTLLTRCGFVQWVPGSDVIVAQAADRLYVWYDLTKPVVHPVTGGELNDAVEIVRESGTTKVLFTDGFTIQLDEVLLEFDAAIEEGDLERAESFLEALTEQEEEEETAGGENSRDFLTISGSLSSMWLHLGNIALSAVNLPVAERAFAALGDIAKVAFIRRAQKDASLVALLSLDWNRFEAGGEFDTVLQTYLQTYNWDRASAFARRSGRPELVERIQAQHYAWLVETGQQSMAANMLEASGKTEEAIAMYLKAGRLGAVAKLILANPSAIPVELVRKVLDELNRKEAFEEAGDLCRLPAIDDRQAALVAYVKAAAYPKAIQLAREAFPDQVVTLENQYGEYLLHEVNDPAQAVNHFIEAGKTDRALEAAINARQYDRAAEIAAILDHVPSLYGKRIAEHYAAREQLEPAVEMYLASGAVRDAVQLLNTRGQYARAFKIAKKWMDPAEAREMYEYIAKQYESEGKYREAERILLAAGEVDTAISMYKHAKQYDQMVRLVKQHHPDLLTETCLYLGKQLEADRAYKQAETYYVAGGDWQLAALMYTTAGNHWEDAYRVSRAHGGATAAKQVAFHWAQSLATPTEAVTLLNRYGLLNQVVDYAVDGAPNTDQFDFALALVQAAGPELRHKLTDIRLRYALHLESEKRFSEAEALFLEANKPREAVVMYLHANAHDEAARVAESYIPDGDGEVLREVLTAHARYRFDRDRVTYGDQGLSAAGTLAKVESLLLRAGRIELAARIYRDAGLWNEAIRVAEQYAPHTVEPLRREMMAEAGSMDGGGFGQQTNSNNFRNGIQQSQQLQQQQYQQEASLGGGGLQEPAAPQVDLYAALKTAEQNDDRESIIRYTILLATQLLRDRLTLESLRMLQKHADSVFVLPDAKKLLSRVAVIILSELEDFTWSGDSGGASGNTADRTSIYAGLRDCFATLLSTNTALSSAERDLFDRYLLICHYLTLRATLEAIMAEQSGRPTSGSNGTTSGTPDHRKTTNTVRELYFRLSVALLRYTDVIRPDKAFYEAGLAARAANRYEMAFVFLNHFLDLVDAIEERDLNVDHSDFVGTDIPFEVPLPGKLYYDPAVVEQCKSWILATSMDTEVSQSLPIDPLRDGEVYEACLVNADGSRCLPCLVTGYPVIRHKMIEFKEGRYAANKEDWNKLLMLAKVTNHKELRQVLHFVGRICGNSTIVKFSFQ